MERENFLAIHLGLSEMYRKFKKLPSYRIKTKRILSEFIFDFWLKRRFYPKIYIFNLNTNESKLCLKNLVLRHFNPRSDRNSLQPRSLLQRLSLDFSAQKNTYKIKLPQKRAIQTKNLLCQGAMVLGQALSVRLVKCVRASQRTLRKVVQQNIAMCRSEARV